MLQQQQSLYNFDLFIPCFSVFATDFFCALQNGSFQKQSGYSWGRLMIWNLFTMLFFEWNSVLICRLCTMGVLPTVKTLTSGHFLPLKPFLIGQILTLFENVLQNGRLISKNNWDQDQNFHYLKKSSLLTKK